MQTLSALTACLFGIVLICVLHDHRRLKEENQQLRGELSMYADGVFYGINKGGYTITIGDDSITVRCKVTERETKE